MKTAADYRRLRNYTISNSSLIVKLKLINCLVFQVIPLDFLHGQTLLLHTYVFNLNTKSQMMVSNG